ncbi:MAG: hypothetical protein FWD66_00405 [Paludibacter sp.]|nr:hypothetical protein [Paludibacter sp.]
MKKINFLILMLLLTVTAAQAQTFETSTYGLSLTPATTNLGIGGTVIPNAKLFVNESIGKLTTGNVYAIYSAISSATLLDNKYKFSGYFDGGKFAIMNGNVGIGTETPTTQLDVAGTINASGNITADWDIISKNALITSRNSNEGGNLILENPLKTGAGQAFQWKIFNMAGGHGNSLQFWAYDNNNGCLNGGLCDSRFTITDEGNVGIGTSFPTTQLDVTGNINASGYIIARDAFIASNNRDTGGTLVLENTSKTGAGQAISWKIFNMTGGYGNSLQFWSYGNNVSGVSRFTITDAGNVGIGRSDPYYKLDVYGTIRAHEIKVNLNTGADFVFEKDYNLMPLNELSRFVSENKHLPDIAPAAEMTSGDTDLGEMQVKLLQKVEELTLYIIQQNEKIENLEAKVKVLENK